MTFDPKHALDIDCEAKAAELCSKLTHTVLNVLKRRGVVVAMSGGIDSSCVAAMAVRALGAKRVFGLMLPERDSSDDSLKYAKALADRLGIRYEIHDIAPALEALGCYRVRNDAVRSVFPAFTPECRWKIVLHGDRLHSQSVNVFYVVIKTPEGEEHRIRLTAQAYLQIVAATNMKQRVRKLLEYYHADRLVFAATGTPNRLEYDQGFFVKLGDGAADVKPIAALYKTQVYAMAAHLGVIPEILSREPTTDTYSLEQSQEDFYFSVHYSDLDVLLWAKNQGLSPEAVSKSTRFTVEQVQRVYDDIDQKRKTTAYLHAPPILLAPVPELEPFHIG